MRLLAHAISQLSANSRATQLKNATNSVAYNFLLSNRFLSSNSTNKGDIDWGSETTWSNTHTKEHFDGQKVGGGVGGGGAASQIAPTNWEEDEKIRKWAAEASRKANEFANGWKERMRETNVLMKQVIEPGARGAYLKDSEKAEMYRLHKENPQVYTVEKLAKDYRIMRQRVHAILWLKEDERKWRKSLDTLWMIQWSSCLTSSLSKSSTPLIINAICSNLPLNVLILNAKKYPFLSNSNII